MHAFYTRLGPGTGVVKSNGSRSQEVSEVDQDLSLLTTTELRCLLVGGRDLSSYIFEYASERPVPDSDAFSLPETEEHVCHQYFAQSWKEKMKALEGTGSAADPLPSIRTLADGIGLCESCWKDAQPLLDEVQRDIWDKLPQFFDIVRV